LNTRLIKTGLIVLMALTMSACSGSTKPTSAVKKEQIQTDAVALDIIKAKFDKVISLDIVSEPVQDLQCLVIANLTYDDGDALISGQIVINYAWANKAWKATNTQFSFTSVSVKEEAPQADLLASAVADNDLNAQFEVGDFAPNPTLVSKSLNLGIGEATYVVSSTVSALSWTATTTYTIKAKYYHQEGWKYTIDSWNYTETTKWAGTWTLQWATYDNETQYLPNEKMTITVNGEMTITKNSAGDQNEARSVNTTFKRSGNPYNIPAVISRDYEDEGRYSTRFIVFKYGNHDNDQFNLELRFDTSTSPTSASYVVKSFDGNLGILTKIK